MELRKNRKGQFSDFRETELRMDWRTSKSLINQLKLERGVSITDKLLLVKMINQFVNKGVCQWPHLAIFVHD